ncbi:TPA: type VI secretion system baseplate subunit TssG [Photobacterium damselae]
MGNADRVTTADLRSDKRLNTLLDQAKNYDFYQLVELLLKLTEQDPSSEEWESNCRLIFSTSASLGFASSDITELEALSDESYRIETAFLGLNGAQSPLPGFLLEQIATENENGVRRAFLDFFNNRLLALVYQLWRKYRYYVCYQDNASDLFSSQLFALVGLSDSDLRGETPINWSKMLSYAGTLAGRSRSPQVVAGIIAHCFELENVAIRQWEIRTVDIVQEQQMRLGMNNCRLGESTIIGAKVKDCTGKFVVEIKDLTRERFNDFLPSGKEYQPLCKLVEFVLREQMAFDLELELRKEEVPSMCLTRDSQLSLGWSSFLDAKNSDCKVKIQVRQ